MVSCQNHAYVISFYWPAILGVGSGKFAVHSELCTNLKFVDSNQQRGIYKLTLGLFQITEPNMLYRGPRIAQFISLKAAGIHTSTILWTVCSIPYWFHAHLFFFPLIPRILHERVCDYSEVQSSVTGILCVGDMNYSYKPGSLT